MCVWREGLCRAHMFYITLCWYWRWMAVLHVSTYITRTFGRKLLCRGMQNIVLKYDWSTKLMCVCTCVYVSVHVCMGKYVCVCACASVEECNLKITSSFINSIQLRASSTCTCIHFFSLQEWETCQIWTETSRTFYHFTFITLCYSLAECNIWLLAFVYRNYSYYCIFDWSFPNFWVPMVHLELCVWP